ncbi:hypothetical protein PIROE2DRAFT_17794 [Piromyces sp. E2]|nr:hypothetical protein PIROE2DRAFT_17794 [Piromyces sp. E2]|eukprot:OUM57276.1 hypothetical protein PIROE2DRAFT_17794 [Piromyces sp. E2]
MKIINNDEYYSAINSEIFNNHRNYCNYNAIVMLLTGERNPLIIKTKIIDQCDDCRKYHLALGKKSYEKLHLLPYKRPNVIWGIYSKYGEEKLLMYNRNSIQTKKTVEAYGVSINELIRAFSSTAKTLARSEKYEAYLSLPSNLDSDANTINLDPIPTSNTDDNRCGPGYGPCKNGLCCNRYGWCTSDPTGCQGCRQGYGVCV